MRSIYDFEKEKGALSRFGESFKAYTLKARREKRTVCGDHNGFHDLYVPVIRKGECIAIVLSGAFSGQEIHEEQLIRSWNGMAGQSASPLNEDFREFVRVALQTPVLQGRVLEAYREALEIFAEMLAGSPDWRGHSLRLRELLVKVFSKQMPHSFFLDWALGRPCNQTTPSWNREAVNLDFFSDEIGLTRIPTTAIAVLPRRSSTRKEDAVGEMLRVYRFQRACFHFGRSIPQTVGGAMEDYGAVFVTSAEPRKNKFQPRKQIEDIARQIQKFAAQKLLGPVQVGVGRTMVPGEVLSDSYHEAVLALHLGKETGKDIVIHSLERPGEKEGFSALRRLLLDLAQAYKTSALSETGILRERLFKRILTLAFQDPEEIHLHFEYALLTLVEALKERPGVSRAGADQLFKNMSASLDKASTVQEKVLAFHEMIDRLTEHALKPQALLSALSLEDVRSHIDERFQEPLRISSLSKMAGMSTATFCRKFKKSTGQGLGEYLQERRLREARRLLGVSHLTVAQVSRQCGFLSENYFRNLFKKKNGLSPQNFRRQFLGLGTG
jgi:AraC-like DNA-binding protein